MRRSVLENVNTKRIKAFAKAMDCESDEDFSITSEEVFGKLSANDVYILLQYVIQFSQGDLALSNIFIDLESFVQKYEKTAKNITKEEIQAVFDIMAVNEVMDG